jgi:transposase
MEYGAIDLHLRRSEIRIVSETGEPVFENRVDTTRAALSAVFSKWTGLRVLLETSTDSEWVAQLLESLGHEVIVADASFAPMYGRRARRIKTDRRDVAALAEACRTQMYRAAHRVSAERRALRQTLAIRRHLITMRSRAINVLRAQLRQEGMRVPSGTAEHVLTRLAGVAVPSPIIRILQPLLDQIGALTTAIAEADARLREAARRSDVATRLMTAPGVGPVVALTMEASLDTPARFGGDASRACAFAGLVPSEDSSGERQRKGHITKQGPRELRAMLIQASWVIWRSRQPGAAALRSWARQLADRRGRRIAIVGLARKLTRVLFAMWRDGRDFVPMPVAS